ncbi:hypothetical protein ACJMK2_028912 [Sinanodonta woodiana]|uniref:G-protein coupled receptors family 1 profile domain-containing protein n=1 Tax=Sinanodonta woodiana TaxID=1069815 RepID=A0ABD3X939_SINWO
MATFEQFQVCNFSTDKDTYPNNLSLFLNITVSSEESDPGPPLNPTEWSLRDVIFVLDEYGVPIMLATGVISNLLLCATVRCTELKKVSTCVYFFSMGIVDTLYLLAMAIPWASTRVVDIYNREGFCQTVYYLSFLTTFLSSWLIIMVLFERFLLLCVPNRVRTLCNAFRTKCYVTVLCVFSVVGHLYLTWTSGVFVNGTLRICTVIPENAKDIIVVRKVDIVFSFIMPVIITLLLLFGVIFAFCWFCFTNRDNVLSVTPKATKFEVRLSIAQGRKSTVSNGATTLEVQFAKLNDFKHSKRISIVCLVLSLVYILLQIPHNILKVRMTFMNGNYTVTIDDRLLLKLFEELYTINFAYKGCLYFTCLPEVRLNLIKICFGFIKHICCKKPEAQCRGNSV